MKVENEKQKRFTTKGTKKHEKKQIQSHHEEHEGSEVKPGSAGRRTGFKHFAFGDQRFDIGSRPAGRRWRVKGNNYLFAGPVTAGRTVPGSPSRPSSRTFRWRSCGPGSYAGRMGKNMGRIGRIGRMRNEKRYAGLVSKIRERGVQNGCLV